MKNMTEQQLIKKLIEERDHALATVETQQVRINKLTAELEKHRWIPCSERLPKEDGNYLISGVWGSGKEAVGDCDFSVNDGYFRTAWNFDTLAWMPLPKAYKDGE